MSQLVTAEFVAEKARIVDAPRVPTKVNRSFELPTALYGATVASYLGFFAVMAVGFGNPGLIIPMVIFAFVVVAAFGVPAVWTRLAPDSKQRAKSWGQLTAKGIQTHTGPTSARDAAIQMLILPVLILLWGFAAVTIAATV